MDLLGIGRAMSNGLHGPVTMRSDQHLPKLLDRITLPATLMVTRTPVGIPKVVQMLRHDSAAVPFGMTLGIGKQNFPIPRGRFRQTLPFSTVTEMQLAASDICPSS